jgi:hypothetical protein
MPASGLPQFVASYGHMMAGKVGTAPGSRIGLDWTLILHTQVYMHA